MTLHPLVERASEGRLPAWAAAGPLRREHLASVAELMGSWAGRLGLAATGTARWRASAFLHDALRDEAPDALRSLVPAELADLPDPVLHGPAAAERLREEGVEDEELLRAVAYHTLGHPELERMGRALYAADFLEPGRPYLDDELRALRERMPDDEGSVVPRVAALRIGRVLGARMPLRPETVAFWNRMVAPQAGSVRGEKRRHG